MDIQLKAGFKKELLAFFRTSKFLILILVLIGLSVSSPLMLVGTSALMDLMGDVYDQLGMDVSMLTQELSSLASFGVSSQLSDVTMVGLLVFLLVINSFAGGEQKKRSIIIPRSSGLGSLPYILPKFAIYPVAMFIFTIMGTIAAGGVSALLFNINDIVWPMLLMAAVLAGGYNMFFVCLHLTLGTATGKAGMSSAICIVASILLPGIVSVLDPSPVYNPFAMNLTAGSALYGGVSGVDMVITMLVALALMAACYFIALFAQNAKKIDNSGEEIII